jgi:FkbM family methyltransferase
MPTALKFGLDRIRNSKFAAEIYAALPNKVQGTIWALFDKDRGILPRLNKKLLCDLKNGTAGGYKRDEVLEFLEKNKKGLQLPEFLKIFRETDSKGNLVVNANNAFLPVLDNNGKELPMGIDVFIDTFLFSVFYNDNYSKELVLRLDSDMTDGPYGYVDNNFDVTVKKGDVVIDAGAWIGDFAAYAVAKGGEAFAFEPEENNFSVLQKTAALNGNKIYPVKKGLGKTEEELELIIAGGDFSVGGSVVKEIFPVVTAMRTVTKIKITTLDKFADEQNLKRIDFIKADIEGAERDMLTGAKNVLKDFAPKLAICTYHLPDDPEVLEGLIMESNPKYRVRHTRKKLFACV